jgi:hypothetical protein
MRNSQVMRRAICRNGFYGPSISWNCCLESAKRYADDSLEAILQQRCSARYRTLSH